MSRWYLLWMFFDALGVIAFGLAVPFVWDWALDSEHRARSRFVCWRLDRRRRREVALYGQPLRGCLYCGSVCEFGSGCANRDLRRSTVAEQARLGGVLKRVSDEPPPALEKGEVVILGDDPVSRLPCPCARCGKEATLLGAFQNEAGHIFCGFNCYRAGGAT